MPSDSLFFLPSPFVTSKCVKLKYFHHASWYSRIHRHRLLTAIESIPNVHFHICNEFNLSVRAVIAAQSRLILTLFQNSHEESAEKQQQRNKMANKRGRKAHSHTTARVIRAQNPNAIYIILMILLSNNLQSPSFFVFCCFFRCACRCYCVDLSVDGIKSLFALAVHFVDGRANEQTKGRAAKEREKKTVEQ